MIELYDYELSGNCYKVRLMLSVLNIEYKSNNIEFYPSEEHKSDDFLKINPLGQLPVISDNGFVLRDAQAILIYLSTKYDKNGSWYPTNDPKKVGMISQWLAFADSITGSASAARLHDTFFYTNFDIEKCRAAAHSQFRILDEHLYFQEQLGNSWVCEGKTPTIADIACFPYVVLSEEGGVSRISYPAIRRWIDRFKRIEGFIIMPGMFPAGPGH
jgi:glutathione S-transferase